MWHSHRPMFREVYFRSHQTGLTWWLVWSDPTSWGLGYGLTTCTSETILVKKLQSKNYRMTIGPSENYFGNGKRVYKEIKIATWNTLSLNRTLAF